MSEKITHEKIVLDLLKKGKIVNCWSILKYGITRLSSVIYNLKKDGYVINTVKRSGKNQYGNNSHWVEYYLVKDKE